MSAMQGYKSYPKDEQSSWVLKSDHDMKLTSNRTGVGWEYLGCLDWCDRRSGVLPHCEPRVSHVNGHLITTNNYATIVTNPVIQGTKTVIHVIFQFLRMSRYESPFQKQ